MLMRVLDIFLNHSIQFVSFGRPYLQLMLAVVTEQKIEYKKKLELYPEEISPKLLNHVGMRCSMLKAWRQFFSDKYDTPVDALIVQSINRETTPLTILN